MSATSGLPSVVTFGDAQLEIIGRDGLPWVRGVQVANALGYANPSADIANLFDRNRDEFTDAETCTCSLQVQGQRREVRIFSPRGCWLVGMLARTDKAKAFRRWVLDVLDKLVTPSPTIQVAAHERRTSTGIPDALRLKTNIDRQEAATERLEQVANRFDANRPAAIHPDRPVSYGVLLQILNRAYQAQFMPGERKDTVTHISSALEDVMGNYWAGPPLRVLQPASRPVPPRPRRPRVKAGRISIAEAARRKALLKDMLTADPHMTHNQVARALGVCYVTAQKWRREIAVNDNAVG